MHVHAQLYSARHDTITPIDNKKDNNKNYS